MAAFRFSLEPVLSYRQSLVEKREMELAHALRDHREAEQILAVLHQRRSRLLAHIEQQRRQRHLDGELMVISESYLHKLEADIAAQTERLRELSDRVASCRAALNEALKEKKKIEQLKEKEARRFAAEQARLEQLSIDDLNTTRYGRRRVRES